MTVVNGMVPLRLTWTATVEPIHKRCNLDCVNPVMKAENGDPSTDSRRFRD